MAKQINQLNDLTFIPEEILFPVDAKNPLTDEYETVKIDKNYLQQNLNEVLSIGNETDGQDIILNYDDVIKNEETKSTIEFIKTSQGGVKSLGYFRPFFGDGTNYIISPTSTSGSGTGLIVDLVSPTLSPTDVYISKIINPGSGYEVGDTVSFLGTQFGLLSPENDYTVEILEIYNENEIIKIQRDNDFKGGILKLEYVSGTIPSTSGPWFVSEQKSTSGDGINAEFFILKGRKGRFGTLNIAPFDSEYNLAIGSNYQVGDTITISGADLDGVDGVDDVIFNVMLVTDLHPNKIEIDNDNVTIDSGYNKLIMNNDKFSLSKYFNNELIYNYFSINEVELLISHFDGTESLSTIQKKKDFIKTFVDVKEVTSIRTEITQVTDSINSKVYNYNSDAVSEITQSVNSINSYVATDSGLGDLSQIIQSDNLINMSVAANSVGRDMSYIEISPQEIEINAFEKIKLSNLQTYADNAAALAGGLTVDCVYKTATGELRIVVRNK